jgi:hypothetical protein
MIDIDLLFPLAYGMKGMIIAIIQQIVRKPLK